LVDFRSLHEHWEHTSDHAENVLPFTVGFHAQLPGGDLLGKVEEDEEPEETLNELLLTAREVLEEELNQALLVFGEGRQYFVVGVKV
jgi:hypothetical protein